MTLSRERRQLVYISLAFVLFMTLLFALTGGNPFSPSPYNTYTLQALAWRDGLTHLPEDVPHLELAIYQGKYFVSFPPVPSVPIYFLTFLFGSAVPDGLLVLLYGYISLMVLFRLFIRGGFQALSSALFSFLILFASSLPPLLLSGAVWFQAQVMALMLTLLSIHFIDKDKPTPALLAYALAVGCRPFNAVYGPLIILLYLLRHRSHGQIKSALLRLLPGILLGLSVAMSYAWYNVIRFGNPFEFGHNYLPEFSFQGGTQFSIHHIGKNISEFIFSLPFERAGGGFRLKQFGFSLFLANPALLLMLFSALFLLAKRKLRLEQGLILAFFIAHLFLSLMHRTFGGYQYGARYAVDLLPYSALFILSGETRRITKTEAAVLLLGIVFAVYGSFHIHL